MVRHRGFRVWSLESVSGLGFGFQGSDFRVWSSGFRVQVLRLKA